MPNHRVLLLNDDPDLARLLASYLESEACEVTIAADGLEGLERLDEVRPELVVSDVHMPRLDGFQFCRVLRSPSHRRWNEVPVILVSYTLREHSTLAISRFVGASDFLALPCGRDEFRARVRRFLHRSGTERPGRGGTILVVDDDEDLAAEVAGVLRRTGYDVTVAASASEARTVAEAMCPFFVLTDFQMPGEDGLALLAWFREHMPETIVTLLTGQGSEEVAMQAITAGASDYLEKPVDLKELPGRVEQIIRKADFQRVAERFHRQILLLRAKNRELEEANRLKNRFLSMASHDLINPLNVIKNWAECILEESAGMDEGHTHGLAVIVRQSDTMLRLIQDVLDLTRLEDGRSRLEPQPLDLRELLGQQLEGVAILARRKGIELKSDLPDRLPTIMADPNRMSEVFTNLLANAVKFCRDGDQVGVRARAGERWVDVQVYDTGPGLGPGEAGQIFEVFQTGVARPTGGEGGFGLGLAIVKGLVELHGGRVAATVREGGGTVFHVRLGMGGSPAPPFEWVGGSSAGAGESPLRDEGPQLPELTRMFLEDVDPRMAALRKGIADFSRSEDGSVAVMFRLAHSLAGAAETYGLPAIGKAGRRLELLMGRIGAERLQPDEDLFELLVEYADHLESALEALRRGTEVDLRAILDRLDRWRPRA